MDIPAELTSFVSAFALPERPYEGMPIATIERRDLEGELWCITRMGQCLNKRGKWEYEPLPSSRSDAFKARTRMSLQEACDLAEAHGLFSGDWVPVCGETEANMETYRERVQQIEAHRALTASAGEKVPSDG